MNDIQKEKVILSDEQYLNMLGEISALFQQALFIDNTIAITDREKFTHYYLGKGAANIDIVGKPYPPAGNVPKVLQTGEQVMGKIPKELYGVEFKSSTLPVKNHLGEIIGTLTVALSLDTQNALHDVIESLSSSTEELSATSEELASSASVLSENILDINNQTQNINNLIEQTNTILNFINQVSNTSRLLGLNASIEAARAGEHGKGFAVVAKEIQKMAENSAKAVKDTRDIILAIQEKVTLLSDKTQEISDIAATQASATQEISATVQSLASEADTVKEIASII